VLGLTASTLSFAETSDVETTLQPVLTSLTKGNYEGALLQLEVLPPDTTAMFVQTKALYTGIAQFALGQVTASYASMKRALAPTDSIALLRLDAFYEAVGADKGPFPALAVGMSAVLPGLGQWYVGRPLDGLNSLGLLAGLTGLTVVAPGLIYLTVPIFSRYYLGGLGNAYQEANDERHDNTHRRLLSILSLYDVPSSLLTSLEREHNVGSTAFKSYKPGKRWLDNGLSLALAGYKQFLSSQDGAICVFEPTCSLYMVNALRREGWAVGLLDGVDRLLRCHPFATPETSVPPALLTLTPGVTTKKPWLAAVSSAVVPGLGKVYTGAWKDGVYAFMVVSAFTWFTYQTTAHKGFSPYTVLYGSLAGTFYLGNIYGSWKSALPHRH